MTAPSSAAERRVLLVGDTHGNTPFVRRTIELAAERGCRRLLQLGDFGFDIEDPEGVVFLNHVQRHCERFGVTLFWIDGNHDAHAPLRALLKGGREQLELRPNLIHLPRGVRWVWQGRDLGALGGAHSIDYLSRTRDVDWWEEERISDEDVVAVVGDGLLDLLVTHEAPYGISPPSTRTLRAANAELARRSGEQIRRAADGTHPRLLVHGHLHKRYTAEIEWDDGTNTTVEGLASDLQGIDDACAVLDLDLMQLEGPGDAPNGGSR